MLPGGRGARQSRTVYSSPTFRPKRQRSLLYSLSCRLMILTAHLDRLTNHFDIVETERNSGRDPHLSFMASEAVSTSGEKTYSRMRRLPVAISTVTAMPGVSGVRLPSIVM